MSDPELSESAKAELEAGREARAKSMEEFAARTKGKPTPTQAENDEARLGKHFIEHEADGSDLEHKQMEGKPGAGYQTRQAKAAAPPPAPKAT